MSSRRGARTSKQNGVGGNNSSSSLHGVLDVLSSNIQEEYDKLDDQEKPLPSHGGAFSVRELRVMHTGSSALVDLQQTTRRALLENWKTHIQTLREYDMFLQYVSYMENFFSQHMMSSDQASTQLHIQNILRLMTTTVQNHRKDASTECRYATLLEIILTFSPYWKMSNHIESLWKKHLKYKVRMDVSTGSYEFRRMAYGVLLSLNWAPNYSPGLYVACGMEDFSLEYDAVPKAIQWVFYPLRSQPILRQDCIHSVLQRLLDGSSNSPTSHGILAISAATEAAVDSSTPCLGKTMLAASVAAHPDVSDRYQVLWLKFQHHHHMESENEILSPLGPNGMTFATYTRYLGSLCHQLGFESPDWSWPIELVEEEGLRRKRHDEKMLQAKHTMMDLMEQHIMRDILLVLDHVHQQDDLSWFQFTENQWILVTTAAGSSAPANVFWTLHVEPWNEAEAIKLFLLEADFPPNHVMGESTEVKSIVRCCGYHLLTVRTVGRWFRLKQVTAGVLSGLEETYLELSTKIAHLTNGKAPSPTRVFWEVMDLVLSPMAVNADGAPTVLMKKCFCSMAVVFFSPSSIATARVPLNAAYLLWGYLLLSDKEMIDEVGCQLTKVELYKHIQFISEALTQLGLIVITEQSKGKFVEIHHELQVKFAFSWAEQMDNGSRDINERRVGKWFQAFTTACLEEGSDILSLLKHFRSKSSKYAMQNIIKLLLGARFFSEAAAFLNDERFIQRRYSILGLRQATHIHLDDCIALQRRLEGHVGGETIRERINPVCSKLFNAVQVYLTVGGDEDRLEATAAVNTIAVAMSQYGFSGKPIACLKAALKHTSRSHDVAASVLLNIAAEHLAQKEFQWSLKYLKETMAILQETNEDDELLPVALRMEAAALTGTCDYHGALQSLDDAIDRMHAHPHNMNRLEIGKALCQKGQLQHSMGLLETAYMSLAECIKLKMVMNEASADFVTAHKSFAHLLIDMEKEDDALDHFEKAIKIAELVSGQATTVDREVIRGSILVLRGGIGSGSQQKFDLARAKARDDPGGPTDCDACTLRYIARLYMLRDDYTTALSYLMDSLQQTCDQLKSLERASCFYDLGMCYASLGKAEEGMSCFETSLQIRISILGESEPVIDTLNGIGNLHKSLGNIDTTREIYGKALEMTQRVCCDDNRRLTAALSTVAELKEASGEYSEAIALLRQCLALQKQDPPHPSDAVTLHRIASLHALEGQLDEAEDSYAEALQIRLLCLGPDHPVTCDTYHDIGVVARKRGCLERARHFFLSALNGRKTQECMERASCETLTEVGHVYRKLGEYDSAIRCYEKCIDILIGLCGAMDEMLATVFLSLGHANLGVERVDDAIDYYNKAYDIRCQLLGNDDNATMNVLRSLGIACFLSGQNEEAVDHLLEFVLHVENKTSGSIDYVAALTIVGDIHATNGNWETAHAAWGRAQKVFDMHYEIAEEYKELNDMVGDRLSDSPQAASAQDSQPNVIEARTNLSELLRNEQDRDFFRTIDFTDD